MQFPKGDPGGKIAQINFDMPDFRRLIWSKGWRLTWEQTELCPCMESAESDAGSRSCLVCDGSGFTWHSPTEVRGIVTGASLNDDLFNRIGPLVSGRLNLTLQPEHLPSRLDRFTALDSTYVFREIAVRGAGVTSALKMPIVRREMELDDGPVTVGVTRCRAQTAGGAAATPLVEELDFDVINGLIDWTKGDVRGTAPAVGKRFAATYYAHPVLVVDDVAYAARDTRDSSSVPAFYQQMLVKVGCKLKHGA